MVNATVHQNVIPIATINTLLDHYATVDDHNTEQDVINKGLGYFLDDDISRELLHPIFQELLGDHLFDTGSYKEEIRPYGIHTDSRDIHLAIEGMMLFGDASRTHNNVCIIPLVEGPEFKTAIFNVWDTDNPAPDYQPPADSKDNGEDWVDFDHCPPWINKLDVDIVYEWKLGDILAWDREMWHTSNNFAKFDVVKKFIIVCMS